MQNELAVRNRRRPIVVVALALLVCGAIGPALVVNGVVRDQERRLLRERAAEASALLTTAFGSITGTLPMMGTLATTSPAAFQGMARAMTQGASGWVGTLASSGDGMVVRVAAGTGPAVGTVLTGQQGALAARAMVTTGLVSDVIQQGAQRHLAFAVGSPVDHNSVTFEELSFDPRAVARPGKGSPFSELQSAVYASPTATASRLVFSTADNAPLRGNVARRTVQVGADKWLLVVKAKTPLVGDFAHNSPWYTLTIGLLTAVLVGAVMELVTRRRAYAMALVDERTAALRDALAEKELLEQGQREAREAAESANRAKSDFLSRMSHELRTPLNAVLGFAQLLEAEDLSAQDHDSVRQILRGGRHLLDLINEVLDITRIESGTFQLSAEPVLVQEVVEDVAEMTRPLAEQANIQLVTGATSGGCQHHVLADRQRLKQVLINLVSNAIKYNRPGGSVALSCERRDAARLLIKVHDTGPGIRPDHLDLLFMPFERLGAEQTNIEGTGIGLALSRRLAEAMGGTLSVDSAVGQGTTFYIDLPLVEGPVERFERLNGEPEPVREAVTPRRKILYIEDNLSNLRLVERILARDVDIELISAMQGRLGPELAREHQPELILLDLHLPDTTGDEVLRQLRDDPQTASIPVAVVSADATAGQIRRLLAEGAVAYLTKPLDVAELRALVDGLPNRV
ncbi:MAG: response regulator [Actinobacteria bacterium]|nr:response regulator [Actinomycetota bacterium]